MTEFNILIIVDNKNTYATQEKLDTPSYIFILNNIKALIYRNHLTIFVENNTQTNLQVVESMNIKNTIFTELCIAFSKCSLNPCISTNTLNAVISSSTDLYKTILIDKLNCKIISIDQLQLHTTIKDAIKGIDKPINITVCGLYENLNINIIFDVMKQYMKEKSINFIYNISGTLYSKEYTNEKSYDKAETNNYEKYRDIIRMYDSIKMLKLDIPAGKTLTIFYDDINRYDLLANSPETFKYKYGTSLAQIDRENNAIVRNKIIELQTINTKYKESIDQLNKTEDEKTILIERINQEMDIAIAQILYDKFVALIDTAKLEASLLIKTEEDNKTNKIANINKNNETNQKDKQKNIDVIESVVSKNITQIKDNETKKLSTLHIHAVSFEEQLDTYQKTYEKYQVVSVQSYAMKKYIKYKQKYLILSNINKLVY